MSKEELVGRSVDECEVVSGNLTGSTRKNRGKVNSPPAEERN